jgi:hypothetical protein
MKAFALVALRLLILALCVLPVLRPFVNARGTGRTPREVTLLLPPDVASNASLAARARRETQARLSLDGNSVRIETRGWGRVASHPVEDLEELGSLLANVDGTLVVVPSHGYWGPAASRFAQKVRETAAFREKRVLLLPREALGSEGEATGAPDTRASFLGLSEIFLPKASFLGEESVASLEVVGRLSPGESAPVEVILRAGASLLTARTETLTADDTGLVHRTLQVPVNFVRTGTQALTATLSSPLASAPLSTATTVVTVHHGKTTLLHIGVGPDWSLRALRQKLKFWPNLDLLSYYILREASDDMSVPSSQLSLIEFPSDKLFGSELPNFHGVVAQNFFFDAYLNPVDTANLARYVQDGGRMLLQYGPLTFQAHDAQIQALFPCENMPEFDAQNTYAWQEGDARVTTDVDLASSLRGLSSRATGTGCVPKKQALVLARTVEGQHPVVLAMPLGKGLVLAVLAGDWHLGGLSREADTPFERTQRLARVHATDTFFQWVVEFLQRRQDGGLRAPDLQSPRLFEDDRIVLLKARGPLRLDEAFALSFDGRVRGEAKPFLLPWLELAALRMPESVGVGSEGSPVRAFGEAPSRFVNVSLRIASREDPVTRSFEWPLFPGTARSRELLANPLLFRGFETLAADNGESTKETSAKRTASRPVPLLEAYPWLLAATLGLLFLERLLVHAAGWRVLNGGRQSP